MSTRLERYTELRKKGLFQGESKELSKVEYKDAPYSAAFFRDRRKVLRKWQEWKKVHNIPEGSGRRKYLNMVKKWYQKNGWISDKGKLDVWRAWRDYEGKWKDKGYDYRKPSKKRRSDMVVTEQKLRRSLGW